MLAPLPRPSRQASQPFSPSAACAGRRRQAPAPLAPGLLIGAGQGGDARAPGGAGGAREPAACVRVCLRVRAQFGAGSCSVFLFLSPLEAEAAAPCAAVAGPGHAPAPPTPSTTHCRPPRFLLLPVARPSTQVRLGLAASQAVAKASAAISAYNQGWGYSEEGSALAEHKASGRRGHAVLRMLPSTLKLLRLAGWLAGVLWCAAASTRCMSPAWAITVPLLPAGRRRQAPAPVAQGFFLRDD